MGGFLFYPSPILFQTRIGLRLFNFQTALSPGFNNNNNVLTETEHG